jgi:hypothetical protein
MSDRSPTCFLHDDSTGRSNFQNNDRCGRPWILDASIERYRGGAANHRISDELNLRREDRWYSRLSTGLHQLCSRS